ncbi:hypothetical protein N7528_002799 [Penicillium herquei]|nr:hypothetical protein N7528_002799 [Penicillium herquei]
MADSTLSDLSDLGLPVQLITEQPHQGLLTQTILASPIIKWILPARLRSKNHNDVVFVSAQRVQIKEVMDGQFLKDVIHKSDFNGPIIGAKVLNVERELSLAAHLQAEGSFDGPSHILVLCVNMVELQFLYYSPDNGFVTFRKHLPQGVSPEWQYGKHIAVDPRQYRSRAVAVSSSVEYFGILWLQSPQNLQDQMKAGVLHPVRDEQFFPIEGKILFLEFLYPKSIHDNSIMLLIIVERDGCTEVMMYTWKENQDMRSVRPEIKEFRLRKQHSLPTMIVPLTKQSSFLVVSPTGMAVYPCDGQQRPKKYPLAASNSEISDASMWTRWARPARNWMYSQQHDGIYLCREDGWIYLLEFGNEGDLETQTSLGKIHCDVDLAFDVLDMGHEGGDFILAAGSTGDGGLFVQMARESPRCVQRFVNWAPIRDAAMVYPQTTHIIKGGIARNRLFASSQSSAGKGGIYEFRWGVEAALEFNVPLDDLPSIRDMWTLVDSCTGGIYVLLSDPVSSLLLYTDFSEEGIIALNEDQTGLADEQTLAAGISPEGALIQVTESATHLFVRQNPNLNTRIAHRDQISVLAVAVEGSRSMIATAVRHEGKSYLYVTRVTVTADEARLDLEEPVPISKEPICLSLQTFGDMTFIFLGNADGAVTAFVLESNTLTQVFETSIMLDNDYDADLSTVVESIVTVQITPRNGSLHAFLLCGLRSGILVPFEIDFNGHDLIRLKQKETTRIGRTSLRLQSTGSSAMFTCDNELWQVSYSPDCIPSECFLRRVWITDQNNPAYFPTSIHGFGLICPETPEPDASIGPLFCFTDRQLLICSMNQEVKSVPRRIEIPGNPRRLIWSPNLQCLVVSYQFLQAEEEMPFTRMLTSHVQFVDPDLQEPILQRGPDDPWRPESAAGEMITCLMDWDYERAGEKFHMMAIGTHVPSVRERDPDLGRLILISPRRDPSDPSKIICTTKLTRMLEGPIQAIAAYGDSLIIGAGNRLVPMSSKDANRKWRRSAGTTLPSAIVSIHIMENLIFVLTARHSWCILEIAEQGTGPNSGSFLICRSWCSSVLDGLTSILHNGKNGNNPMILMSHRGRVNAGVIDLSQWHERSPDFFKIQPATELHQSIIRFVSGSQNNGPFYGLSVTGSIYRFTMPDQNYTPLLRFLQNIAENNEILCPSTRKRTQKKKIHDLSNCRIDGDILARLGLRGPEFLDGLIQPSVDTPEPDQKEVIFRALAQRVLGDPSTDAVIAWLRRLLDVPS